MFVKKTHQLLYTSRYLKNKSLKLFDVTLRDGLQSIPKIYSLNEKMDILTNIITERNPYAIEIWVYCIT